MRRFPNFNHPHTCPKIDQKLKEVEEIIKSRVSDFVFTYLPNINIDKQNYLSNDFACTMFSDVSKCFEEVRNTNEDMRDKAEKQITDLLEIIKELEDQVKNLEYRLSRVH